jgi:hypothetical protein
MLASSVLVMESFVMGFALLLAMKDHSSAVLIVGCVIAILCLLAPGLLKKKAGWILGWALQVALLAYGFVVTSMFLVGTIFLGLWRLFSWEKRAKQPEQPCWQRGLQMPNRLRV